MYRLNQVVRVSTDNNGKNCRRMFPGVTPWEIGASLRRHSCQNAELGMNLEETPDGLLQRTLQKYRPALLKKKKGRGHQGQGKTGHSSSLDGIEDGTTKWSWIVKGKGEQGKVCFFLFVLVMMDFWGKLVKFEWNPWLRW